MCKRCVCYLAIGDLNIYFLDDINNKEPSIILTLGTDILI